jgi:hypothetical protein
MAVHIITGKLGGGKTLSGVGLIRDALRAGRAVASNVDLYLEHLLPWQTKGVRVYRLPDKLSAASFEDIGIGNESYDESRNGLLVLDEGGLSLNSRDYREQGRKEFIQWAIHSRKRGWDLAIIVQHIDGLDKQIRDFFGEHVVRCARLDRLRVPVLGWVAGLVGIKLHMPRIHKVTCKYGQESKSPVVWTKWFKGSDLYDAYDTRQMFNPVEGEGVYQLLSPWHVKGRYRSPWHELRTYVSGVYRRWLHVKLGRVFVFFCAAALGGWTYASFIPERPGAVASVEVSAIVEDVVLEPEPEPVDPWETAYIGSYVGNVRTMEFHYGFRSADGERLLPKGSWTVQAIGSCKARVRSPERAYMVTCEAAKASPKNLFLGDAAKASRSSGG